VVEVPSADNVLRSGGTEGTVLVAVAGACEAHVEKAEKMISAILSKKQACVSRYSVTVVCRAVY